MKFIKKYRLPLFFALVAFFMLFCGFQDPGDTEPFKLSFKLIVAIVLGLYEVIVRLVPTVLDLSWLSWIIKLLAFANEFLNRKKKK
jgi:hypothetical protein